MLHDEIKDKRCNKERKIQAHIELTEPAATSVVDMVVNNW
jgi:hypothetical protein